MYRANINRSINRSINKDGIDPLHIHICSPLEYWETHPTVGEWKEEFYEN